MILHKMNMNPTPTLAFGSNSDGFDTILFERILWWTLIIPADIWVAVWPRVVRSFQLLPLVKLQSFPSIFAFTSSKRTSNFVPTQGSRGFVCLSVSLSLGSPWGF